MRNNEERLGTKQNISDEEVMKKSVDFVEPTEFIDLPSRGLYYPEDHILKNKKDIEIKFMTTKEEDILNNKSLIKKGIAIDRLLKSIIMDKRIDIDSLLICDKNAITIAARTSGYGPEYKVKVTCPACEHIFENVFDLSTIDNSFGDESIIDANGHFIIELPKTKASVKCKLLNGYDIKVQEEALELKKKNEKKHGLVMESPITDQLKAFIVSIEDSADKGAIHQFVTKMPSYDSRFLRNKYQEVVPKVDLNQSVLCPKCEEQSEVIMPIGAEFFWPK